MFLYLIVFILVLIVIFEFLKTMNEHFNSEDKPSSVKLLGVAQKGQVNLFWHIPTINYENIYTYLIYIKEDGRDVKLISEKSISNKQFYKKNIISLNPLKKYKFKVVAVSSDGLSNSSNIIELQPKDKNVNIPRPIPLKIERITCNPDGTYTSGLNCLNPIYPNAVFDDSNHSELLTELNEKKPNLNFNF